MKKKNKTFGMRIWLSFTTVIILIVSLISLVHLHSFYNITVENRKEDLLIMHNFFLERNYQSDVKFSDFRNLKDANHVLINEDTIVPLEDLGKPAEPYSRQRTVLENEPSLASEPVIINEPITPEIIDEETAKLVEELQERTEKVYKNLKTIAKGTPTDEYFSFKVDRMLYIGYISYVDETYFLSYTPIIVRDGLVLSILVLALMFILGGLLTMKLMSRYITKPLKDLEELTKKIAKKEFDSNIEIETDDEIGRLAKAMLDMQDKLKEVDVEEKKFLQSISHDLKTPISVIIAHADAINDGVYDDPKEAAEIIKNEAIVLNKKVRQLLYLNTLDFSLKNQEELEEINLKELLTNMGSRFKFSNPNLDWELNLENTTMIADYDKFSISIENIIDNALRYAKSKITLNLFKDNGNIIIEIINDGEHISDEAINKIFDNLYKDKRGKFGLGLSISKKIVEHYNGNISAENIDNGVKFKMIYKKSDS